MNIINITKTMYGKLKKWYSDTMINKSEVARAWAKLSNKSYADLRNKFDESMPNYNFKGNDLELLNQVYNDFKKRLL